MRDKVEVPAELLCRLWDSCFHCKEVTDTKLRDDILPYVQLAIYTPRYHIEGRRWFDKGPGNTYHTARVFENGELVHNSGIHYGYGDQFLDTAFAWLKANRKLPANPYGEHYGTQYLRDMLQGTYSVTDVAKKSELL